MTITQRRSPIQFRINSNCPTCNFSHIVAICEDNKALSLIRYECTHCGWTKTLEQLILERKKNHVQ